MGPRIAHLSELVADVGLVCVEEQQHTVRVLREPGEGEGEGEGAGEG